MSQWTHIRGGFELVSSPYEQKPMKISHPKREDFADETMYDEAVEKWKVAYHKSLYLPYPEEQFKLDMPKLGQYYDKKTKKTGKTLDFNAHIYSLPRAKKYIEEAFKLMPQGELGIRYSVEQSILDSSSSSFGFMHNCLYKYYKKALDRMYYSENYFDSYNYDDLRKYMHISDECSYDSVSHILVGMRDDIRYASAAEVQEGLEKVFKYLEEHDISIEDGYLEWQDEWDSDHIYAWRKSRLDFNISHQFLTLDRKTNKVVHSKTWAVKRDENGKRMHDEDWNDIWEVIEKDGPFIDKEELE